MLIIPIFLRGSERPKCPSCDKIKKTKEVCVHCNYEYPPQKTSKVFIAFIILFIIAVILGFLSLINPHFAPPRLYFQHFITATPLPEGEGKLVVKDDAWDFYFERLPTEEEIAEEKRRQEDQEAIWDQCVKDGKCVEAGGSGGVFQFRSGVGGYQSLP